jgi:hypothetical protein
MSTATDRRPRLAYSRGGDRLSREARKCNLCEESFAPRNSFERFCPLCKSTSELLRFGHWLPEVDDAIRARLPA